MTQNVDPPAPQNPAQPPAPGWGMPAAPPPPAYGTAAVPAPTGAPHAYGGVPAYGAPGMVGAPGKIRSTGVCMLLTIVTFGFYTWYWFYSVHDEMKRHSGQGIGGAVALLLAIFVGIVSPFITSAEVGGLYERTGRSAPVSGATGLWYLPGIFILVGPFVWFIKTNGALNAYWRAQGVAS